MVFKMLVSPQKLFPGLSYLKVNSLTFNLYSIYLYLFVKVLQSNTHMYKGVPLNFPFLKISSTIILIGPRVYQILTINCMSHDSYFKDVILTLRQHCKTISIILNFT